MVSIIIPAFNCMQYIEHTVRSVLEQSFQDYELIVIDDASTDRTADVLGRMALQVPRMQLVRNSGNMGVAQTRNRGLQLASGEYIAFLDADDLWMPDKLECQMAYMQRADLDICYTGYSFVDEQGAQIRSAYHVPRTLDMQMLLKENVIGCSTALMRRAAIGNIQMRSEYAHEDYVFWLELMQNSCRFGGIDQPLMQYRISRGSRSSNKRGAAANRWRIYRSFLGMTRAASLSAFASYSVHGIRKHFFL